MVDVRDVPKLLQANPGILEIRLIGSRARGEEGPLSDWDFAVAATDAALVIRELPALLESLRPIAFVPDPLARQVLHALIVPGPVKIDLFFDQPHEPEPPWVVDQTTLASVNAHFWDWTLWLAGKQLKGQEDLVRTELVKMHTYLLEPLGAHVAPRSIDDAIRRFDAARGSCEARLHTPVTRALDDEILPALRRFGLIV